MAYTLPHELEVRVLEEMRTGGYADQQAVIVQALDALQRQKQDEACHDDWPAIKEALDDIEAGVNKPMSVDEAFDKIRHRHGIS